MLVWGKVEKYAKERNDKVKEFFASTTTSIIQSSSLPGKNSASLIRNIIVSCQNSLPNNNDNNNVPSVIPSMPTITKKEKKDARGKNFRKRWQWSCHSNMPFEVLHDSDNARRIFFTHKLHYWIDHGIFQASVSLLFVLLQSNLNTLLIRGILNKKY